MKQNVVGELYTLAQQNHMLQDLLRNCPLAVLEKVSLRMYAPEEYLVRRGEKCDNFFVIIEGSVTIHNMSSNGKKYIIGIHHAGKCIGELEIMSRRKCISNAQARSAVRVLVVPRSAYLYWLDHDRDFGQFMLNTLCDKMYCFTQSTTANTLYGLRSRLASFVLDNMQLEAGENTLHYTVEELADVMGVTARSVSRILKEFREKQLITMRGRTVQIKDSKGLEAEQE